LNLQKKEKRNKGFYIALGICLIAVGTAAWTTYSSVTNYTTPKSTESETKNANNSVSGIFVAESSAPASSAPASSASPSSVKPASSAAAVSSAKPTVAAAESFVLPVNGKVLESFSKKPVYNKTLGDYRAHVGTDLSAKSGEAVNAIAQGVVTAVRSNDQYGNTVIVKHGSLEAWYCGLDKMTVKEKQTISQGQQIGTVGTNPLEAAEEPHLFLILKKDGQYIDPMSVLK